ncbi:MAG TPA: ribosome small subunit-dependent GTPase A [Streptosporangiaceae bacterium]|nr:ribosome small subunit-dependent GTPase A [Streptosporangiaceae bacterium]
MGADARAGTLTSPARRSRLDEDDVRVRPGKSSRPRTRRRPAHEDAIDAFVTGVDRGRYRSFLGDRMVTAMKARELGRGSIVVGDRVSLAGDVSGEPGTLARVVRVQPRTSVLRRSAEDDDPSERAIVANADQLMIVTALANPTPRPRLIDRFLVAAYDAGLEPLLCLTKADLAAPDELLAAYRPLGVRSIALSRPFAGQLEELRALLAGRISVLVGHSGVGKSTLVNALLPDAARAVGIVSPVTGRGRHTSSAAVALPLPGGGWIIDTPGLRSFGLGHIAVDRVVSAFPELAEAIAGCQPGCSHLEAGCGLDEWVAEHGGPAEVARLDSLRRLLRSREGLDPVETPES